ncbi:MAG: hypothetical protein CTY31_09835 [Hyphomicrobium sp.]|nr:MAG: hypothetical protein CTY39_07280 [Hyphomicrobium sp.]PPC99273.1 MAG: hypothetical protein CTY31_09835 [Hyphomicrobium sp.]
MSDLLAGLGVALVLEGMLWALAPDMARRMLAEMASLANTRLQPVALGVVAFGVFIVWLARG